MDEWRDALLRERRRRDEFFGTHPNSPLSEGRRERFDGLSYYDPDPDYRFTLSLHRRDDPETVTVETTQGGTQTYERCGTFEFRLGGSERRLWAYRNESDDRLWVPFRDGTNGETTYPGGRYVDLDGDDRDGDSWVVDFNTAYTPFCAYTDDYDCPLVPERNTLETRIEAGQRYDQ